MSAFIWTMIVVFSLSVLSHGYNIVTHNTERNLTHSTVDLVLSVIMLGWAVRMLP